MVDKYSTEQFSVMVPGWGCSQGCHGYLLPFARALSDSTNFAHVGTSAKAYLLVMSLMFFFFGGGGEHSDSKGTPLIFLLFKNGTSLSTSFKKNKLLKQEVLFSFHVMCNKLK